MNFLVFNKDTDDSSSEEVNAGADDAGKFFYGIENAEKEQEPDPSTDTDRDEEEEPDP